MIDHRSMPKKFINSLGLVPAVLLGACSPNPPESAAPIIAPKVVEIPATSSAQANQGPPLTFPAPPALIPSGSKHVLKAQIFSARGISFTAVTFDRRDHHLVVADQTKGPGSEFGSAEAVAQGNLAAINGGFFTPQGEPLGLVRTQGKRRGGLNRSSFLGTGFFTGPEARLMSRTQFLRDDPGAREILQSGPRLVWNDETLTGLSDQNERPRSFLVWDGHDHFGLGYANSASLKGLSEALQNQPLPGFQIVYALNIDGGSSCDFWVSSAVNGGGLTRKSFFNKDVRNYLVLKTRK